MAEDSRPDDAALLDALKPYLALAAGFMEMSAGRAAGMAEAATQMAQSFIVQGAASGAEAKQRVEEIASAGIDPEQFTVLVRDEVDRIARRMGFVRADEIASLRRQVDRLEDEVEQMRAGLAALAQKSEGKGKGAKKHAKKATAEEGR